MSDRDKTVGLRARRKAETRSALATAALTLAVERGAEAVTVEDIAASAGVSTRTFFNYFPSKERAFISDDIERGKRLLLHFRQAPNSTDVWRTLTQVSVDVLTTVKLPARELALKQELIRTSDVMLAEIFVQYSSLESQLTVEIARRLQVDTTHVLPGLMAGAFTGAMRGASHRWLATGSAVEYPVLLADALGVLAPAFTAATARTPIVIPSPAAVA